jgi:hypothetical protein
VHTHDGVAAAAEVAIVDDNRLHLVPLEHVFAVAHHYLGAAIRVSAQPEVSSVCREIALSNELRGTFRIVKVIVLSCAFAAAQR